MSVEQTLVAVDFPSQPQLLYSGVPHNLTALSTIPYGAKLATVFQANFSRYLCRP